MRKNSSVVPQPPLLVLMPVHNEEAGIASVVEEVTPHLANLPARLFLLEDGSRDGTKAVLKQLQTRIDFDLATSPQRKGYAQAIKEALLSTRVEWVLCMDSDGQCPASLISHFWKRRHEGPVLYGARTPRRDPWIRLLCSKVFLFFFKSLFPKTVSDPSCPMVLIHRSVIEKVVPEIRRMREGFWWEFSALLSREGITPIEIPIPHRTRRAGQTHIFRLTRFPGIFLRSLSALFSLRFGNLRNV